jgi:hypothetical protein
MCIISAGLKPDSPMPGANLEVYLPMPHEHLSWLQFDLCSRGPWFWLQHIYIGVVCARLDNKMLNIFSGRWDSKKMKLTCRVITIRINERGKGLVAYGTHVLLRIG